VVLCPLLSSSEIFGEDKCNLNQMFIYYNNDTIFLAERHISCRCCSIWTFDLNYTCLPQIFQMKTKAGITPHAAVNNLYIRTPEDGHVNVRNM